MEVLMKIFLLVCFLFTSLYADFDFEYKTQCKKLLNRSIDDNNSITKIIFSYKMQ